MAQATVHNDVRLDIAQSDARMVAGAINQHLIAPAVLLNFGAEVTPPNCAIRIDEPEDVSARVKDIAELAKAGVMFSASEARRLVRMSDPDKDDETFGGTVKPAQTAKARLSMARASTAETLDDFRDELLGGWQPVMSEMLAPIMDAVETSESYEEALAKIAALDGLPDDLLMQDLLAGAWAARAEGDVSDG